MKTQKGFSLVFVLLLIISVLVGIFGIVAIISSLGKMISFGFSTGSIIDYGPGLLLGIILFLFAKSLDRKAHKIKNKVQNLKKEEKETNEI